MKKQHEGVSAEGRSIEEILRKDHDEIDGEWATTIELKRKGDDLALVHYRRFVEALDEHIGIEEDLLFPYSLSTRAGEVSHLIDIMREEHANILKGLGTIRGALSAGRTPRDEDELELRNILGDHNAREEGFYYPFFDSKLACSPEGKRLAAVVLARCHCQR